MSDNTASEATWAPPVREILSRRLLLGMADRWLLRAFALLARQQVRALHGLENISPANDPFILAVNHSIRREAVLVPALLFLHRNGRFIHFFSDWNNLLIPGFGLLIARAGTITVTRKPARPSFLNVLKPLFEHPVPPIERARRHLEAGRSVGIFPEGTVNRDPGKLLPARIGMARLSLETGVPVVPVGIRFPESAPGRLLGERAPMDVFIGAPMPPPAHVERARLSDVRTFTAAIMNEIGHLSGKQWQP